MIKHLMIGLLITAALAGALTTFHHHPAQAQDATNLLTNGSMERPYYGQGGVSTRTAPAGWSLWVSNSAPEAFPHTDKVQVRDGEVSWNIHQGYTPFTAAGYQTVSGLNKGDNVTLTAYGWVYTCNDTSNSCIIPDPPYRKSDTSANAQMKVGIDPNGGTDPTSASIVWSAVTAPYDQWAQMTVSATANGGSVTVFLYATQTVGMALDNAYWDQASLVRGGAGGSAAGAATAVPPTAAEVPFVVAQAVQPDGSIVHTVQAGDTLSSIAYAYRDYGVTNASIAALNPGMKPNTRVLVLGQKVMILPPGSVDPATGKLIPAGSAPAGTPAGTPAEAPAGTPAEAATQPTTNAEVGTPVAFMPQVTSTPTAVVVNVVPAATEEVAAAPVQTEEAAAPVVTEEVVPAATEAVVVQTEEVAAVQTEEAAAPVVTVQPTATTAPSATPQEVAAATTGSLCVTMFDDANQNFTHDSSEASMAGGQVELTLAGSAPSTYDYDDSNGAFCLDLEPGAYQVRALAPQGYGMTTTDTAVVNLVSGRRVSVAFGGAQGYTPNMPSNEQATGEAPQAGAAAPVVQVVEKSDDNNKSALDRLYDNAGLFVLGFAGLVMVSGTVLVLALRRFSR